MIRWFDVDSCFVLICLLLIYFTGSLRASLVYKSRSTLRWVLQKVEVGSVLYKIDAALKGGSRFKIEKKTLDSILSVRSASVLVLPPVLEPRRRRPSPAGPASMPPPLPMRAQACRTCTPAYALRDQQPSPSSGRAGAASVRSRCVELRLRRPPIFLDFLPHPACRLRCRRGSELPFLCFGCIFFVAASSS